MKIEWLPAAQREFGNQIIYIADRNPTAAVRIGDAVEAAVEQLAQYPRSGRPGRVAGTQELVVTDTPYIVVYRIRSNTVVILRVLHGAQRWP
ncbi:type II toxin-antitoxin system RelE/ParE family toxin [Nitrospirillum amazonense]|uniref:Toxin ParE1/3/4 n=1 Tax=Nitrospirillum amazonense TaxID=28077 RepID=A0A560K9K1_9PROT|nr:type II toxin-antitoxin system RelE/ParE family toxin [Nitrospirillum amazonense]MDG3443780.1 type II toxin-antitoxin system RelE/ParE family toxin [Nitrospirillum amazonense]TWB77340.1 toxin ParE1/3/4 [Nitrospirillum amazonense]